MVNQILASVFQDLSRLVLDHAHSFTPTRLAWQSFVRRAIVTYVTGESPNPTDSGYLFARKARQVLDLYEDQILNPAAFADMVRMNPDRHIETHNPLLPTRRPG
jgi:hypothetical protein